MGMATLESGVGAAPVLTDADVVRRVRAGDSALFEVLMRRHNQRVYRVVRSILRDHCNCLPGHRICRSGSRP